MRYQDVTDLPAASGQGWSWGEEGSRSIPVNSPDDSASPRISIVTPSYNQAMFLEETIRSVLLQGYPNLEYIVMDGGSIDGSVEIIRKYEPWLSYWQSGRDGGQADAINSGWRRSTGQAITWLNSDDVLAPGALMMAAQELFAKNGPDFVYGDNILIDQNSTQVGMIRGREFTVEDIAVRAINPIPQPGFLMKRDMLESVGMLDTNLHFAMDFDYWVRMTLHGVRAKYLASTLAAFRDHVKSKTSSAHVTRIQDRYFIYEKTFSSTKLTDKYVALRKRAAAYVELNAAYISYKAADRRRARRHALRHIWLAGIHASPLALGVLALSLVSK